VGRRWVGGELLLLLLRSNCLSLPTLPYLLVLNLLLDVVDGVRRLDVKGDGLACQSLDKN